MFERFTDTARKVIQTANQEAMRFNREYINTEHVLLGLVKVGSGRAVYVLKNLNCDLEKIRLEVEKRIPSIMNRPQTPVLKNVLEFALEEVRNLNQNTVGTEYILLGLLREQAGIGAQVLMEFGLDLEKVRDEVKRLTDVEED